MYETEVKFDRVFDIERLVTRRRRRTRFGFEYAGKVYQGVVIEGWPEILDGQTVTALLKEPGDWSSLQGWLCHDTGTIAGPRPMTVRAILAWLIIVDVLALPLASLLVCSFAGRGAMPMAMFGTLLAGLAANALIVLAANHAGRVVNRLEPLVLKLQPRRPKAPLDDAGGYTATMTKLWDH